MLNDYFNCIINFTINSTFGIKEVCIFNKIIFILKNLSVDSMRDLLEGICRYDLSKILILFTRLNDKYPCLTTDSTTDSNLYTIV